MSFSLPLNHAVKIAAALVRNGWRDAPVMDVANQIRTGQLDQTLEQYRRFYHLDAQEVIAHVQQPRFCSRPDVERLASNNGPPLPGREIRWYAKSFDLPGLEWSAFAESVDRAFTRITQVCKLTARNVGTPEEANTLVECGPIDGALGTLAWAELANGDPNMIGGMMFDNGDAWQVAPGRLSPSNQLDVYRVILHEAIHRVGLPHDTRGQGALMDPLYSLDVDDVTDLDIERLQALYGPPSATTKPVGGDTPARVDPKPDPAPPLLLNLTGATLKQEPWGVSLQLPGVRIQGI